MRVTVELGCWMLGSRFLTLAVSNPPSGCKREKKKKQQQNSDSCGLSYMYQRMELISLQMSLYLSNSLLNYWKKRSLSKQDTEEEVSYEII